MDRDTLIYKAIQASKMSYSPFSHYKVGAALLIEDGTVFFGTNVENDSYGLTMCAERSAIFSAISNGARPKDFVAMAVVTVDGGTSCGACRQVLAQFNMNMPIHFCAVKDDLLTQVISMTPADMLPQPFKL